MINIRKFFAVIIFISVSINSNAQIKKITYKSAVLYTTEEFGPDIKILIDSVIFYHENSQMTCDSALFNPSKNMFDAFGNIQIIKPGEDENEKDTVFLYGDTLHYLGNIKMAKIRSNVILKKDSLTLTTDSLDYDLKENIGYYSAGGRTVNKEDTLTSILGYYYSNDNELFFKDSVIVKNPRFTLYSDTLKHNTISETSYFLGPTQIVSKENFIYCENGWYNHKTDKAQFAKNSYLKNKEKTLKGDSIKYDRNTGIGQAFMNVTINDTVQNAYLKGNYGEFHEKTEYSLMTKKALFIQVTDNLDSLFLHADTLCAYIDTLKLAKADSLKINKVDVKTAQKDSTFRVVLAYSHAKIFKSDLQAKCDSLVYSFRDSVIEMYDSPVMWSDSSQLSADFIIAYTIKNEVRRVDMKDNAMMISQSDSLRFNQISGKKMVGYIDKRILYKVDVFEKGKSIYFLRDDNKLLLGTNIISCKNMSIYLKDKKVKDIWFYEKPTSTMYPPMTLPESERKLPNFKWDIDYRPVSKKDIFIWKKEK